jgi:iron complex transport system substrate-binding protein
MWTKMPHRRAELGPAPVPALNPVMPSPITRETGSMALRDSYPGFVRRHSLAAMMIFVLSTTPLSAAETPSKPQAMPIRIASLNLCTDELVLRLADRSHVASVSWLSRDPEASDVADIAASVPINHGLAEEIIPLGPDLIVAGTFTTRTAVALLKQTRFRLVEFGIPDNLEDVERQIIDMARLLGEPARGQSLVDDMNRRMTALGPWNFAKRPTALVFNPNGFTVGRGTLVDDILTRAGLDNVAAHMNLGNYTQIPLEVLVRSAVDVLIINADRDGPPSLATEMLSHPVLSRLGAGTHVVVLPSRLWTCGGPENVEVIARLREVAESVREGVAGQ